MERFLEELKKKSEVFDINPPACGDKLPFKKYFFPAVQETFSSDKKGKIKTANPIRNIISNGTRPADKFVLFGLNLPQLEALTQLDEIMSKPYEDFFYWQNRKQSIVIGVIDEPLDVAPGGDIVLQKIEERKYKVWAENARSKKIIKEYGEFFNEIASSQSSVARQSDNSSLTTNILTTDKWSQSMRQLLLDSELLANAVEWSWKGAPEIWEDLGQKCLGCGICTYVCPLCHCFSIEDRVGLDDKCSRCRKWDACTLPGFSKIAGGHSFRPTLKERYYNWFYHKFVRAYKEYGKSQCVGCGACKRNCPAGIDIKEVLKKILDNYRENENG